MTSIDSQINSTPFYRKRWVIISASITVVVLVAILAIWLFLHANNHRPEVAYCSDPEPQDLYNDLVKNSAQWKLASTLGVKVLRVGETTESSFDSKTPAN